MEDLGAPQQSSNQHRQGNGVQAQKRKEKLTAWAAWQAFLQQQR